MGWVHEVMVSRLPWVVGWCVQGPGERRFLCITSLGFIAESLRSGLRPANWQMILGGGGWGWLIWLRNIAPKEPPGILCCGPPIF